MRFPSSLIPLALAPALMAGPVQFNEEVRPILSDKCFFCHGPDSEKREADLRLDLRESAIAEKAIVPGDPDASEILRRVVHRDPDDVMPPPEAKLGRLTNKEVDTLRRWIAEGAEYQKHWAFEPVRRPEVPKVVDTTQPIRTPVDAFVFPGLAARGLAPQPEAARETLIRRVTLDLTGLPPTPDEVRAFVADDAPDAYEKLVDRLLASPRYGERMATDWLDLARYADSYGFQRDNDREVWPWRDWVIKALNRNQPYDEFLTWQLAGDLLDNPTDEQILATAFNRLHQQKVEGGSVEEEFRVEYVADRVETFGTAFLGMTMQCARCHDHKFDPISQKDYFSLFAFFQNIDEAGLYSFFTPSIPTPTLLLMDEGQKETLRGLEEKIAAARDEARNNPGRIGGRELTWYRFEERAAEDHLKLQKPVNIGGGNTLADGRDGKAVLLSGDDAVTLPVGNFRRDQPFSVSLWMKTPDAKDRAVVFHRSKAWTDAASRGYEFLIEEGRLKWSLIHFWPGNAISVRTVAPAPVDEWVHVTTTYDGSSRADGLKIYVNGEAAETEVIRDKLTKQITGGGGNTISIGERMRDRGFKGGLVDDFRVIEREVLADEAPLLRDGKSLPTATDGERATMLETLRALRQQRDKLLDGTKEMMVMRELPEPKKAYRLDRGLYDQRREEVPMAVPESLPPLPEGAPLNRLGLARWLTDPDHPLTSRTAVNRFWQACFGRGLVETAEDFGSQGARPDHPELLDWLSAEFMESGWDMKRLLRTIVLSHTYRQRTFASPEVMAEDPPNAWLARGPRNRLSAEMIRDQALAASGLLVEKQGGPPVRPYDLALSFKPAKPDRGEGLYRRSLYTHWKRTGPSPLLMTFDAVKRDVCLVRRDATITPMQALVTLNGTQFTEAARVLAETLHAETGGDPDKIISQAFWRTASRAPDADEQRILRELYREQLAHFSADESRAPALLAVGHRPPAKDRPPAAIAAAATTISAILNYDPSLTK